MCRGVYMSKWILTSDSHDAGYQLFCFPHAGSGAIKYLKWANFLNERITVRPVLLPGREYRVKEPCIENFDEMIDALFEGIKDSIVEKRYSMYGHSMGSILAYELAQRIEREGMRTPDYLFLSGSPLFTNVMKQDWVGISDDEIAEYLYLSGGTPRHLIENEVFKEVFFPIFRSDHAVVNSYHFKPDRLKSKTKVHVFAAKDDTVVDVKYTEKIKDLTENFKISYFTGGHFFNDKHTGEICRLINDDLTSDMLI